MEDGSVVDIRVAGHFARKGRGVAARVDDAKRAAGPNQAGRDRVPCALPMRPLHLHTLKLSKQFARVRHDLLNRVRRPAREGLHFVQNHDGARDVVDPPKVGGPMRKQALEKADRRRDNNRCLPVLGGAPLVGALVRVLVVG